MATGGSLLFTSAVHVLCCVEVPGTILFVALLFRFLCIMFIATFFPLLWYQHDVFH
jgi:hypothetical protein